MVKSRYIGNKLIPPLTGNPYNGYINPYIGLMTIPYYMEINRSLDPSTYGSLKNQLLQVSSFPFASAFPPKNYVVPRKSNNTALEHYTPESANPPGSPNYERKPFHYSLLVKVAFRGVFQFGVLVHKQP